MSRLRGIALDSGRLRSVPGIGPKTEARLIEALGREAEPRPAAGLLVNRARELTRAIDAGATPGSAMVDHEMPWGTHRQGGFRDPFGHNWSVGDGSPLRAR